MKIYSSPARILTGVFHLMYHQFAWSYDAIAWVVSSGHWRDWTLTALDMLASTEEGLILELGFGPGHIQLEMAKRGIFCAGIDESWQMSQFARRKFKRTKKFAKCGLLIRARAENLPIQNETIAVILSTFPAEYIFQNETIENWQRVLIPQGKVIILMGVEPGNFSIINILTRLIYRISKSEFKNILGPQDYLDRIRNAGFEIESKSIIHKKDRLWFIYGNKI